MTRFLSKIYEKFIADWILKYVGDQLDPLQFGGTKGNSITHYMIHLLNFILSNLDSSSSTGILAAVIDFSKAFNRLCHSRIITIMNDLGLPGWLLKLIASYLSKRVMIVRFKGSESKEENMPGGSPQGTILGVVIFILQMILMRSISLNPNENFLTFPGEKSPSTSCKFIDDLTSAVSFKIKDLEHSDDITKPLVYHSRTEHILPSLKNILVPELERIVNFTETNKMNLNTKNTSSIMHHR